jgi:MoaA/NifB/PqqE/SkfB family radical SAM enzyme
MTPQEISDMVGLIKPPNVQLSGGEPLLRDDIVEVVATIKKNNKVPYIVFVTNGLLLTEEIYSDLCKAGVDQFSVSLDFPDERHDKFRNMEGLFGHLNYIIPKLVSHGKNNIVLNTAITHENFKDIKNNANLALDWGVCVSFSCYTVLRTGNKDYCITDKDELALLKQLFKDVIELNKKTNHIVTAETTLRQTYKFFEQGSIPNCQAGKRFLVIAPNGMMLPCAMHRNKFFKTQKEVVERFGVNNKCGYCFVSVRSFTEKSMTDLFNSTMSSFRSLSRPAAAPKTEKTDPKPVEAEMD